MKKTILAVSLALALCAPAVSHATALVEIVDNMDIPLQDITISIDHNVLHVSGAAGLTMQIYKITGVGVMSVTVDGDDKYYPLNLAKGCYIVKIGKVARKISIV